MGEVVVDVAGDSVSKARSAAVYNARALGSLAFELGALVTLSRVPRGEWSRVASGLGHRVHALRESLERLSFLLDHLEE